MISKTKRDPVEPPKTKVEGETSNEVSLILRDWEDFKISFKGERKRVET